MHKHHQQHPDIHHSPRPPQQFAADAARRSHLRLVKNPRASRHDIRLALRHADPLLNPIDHQ